MMFSGVNPTLHVQSSAESLPAGELLLTGHALHEVRT
jgi:hypothetical protein